MKNLCFRSYSHGRFLPVDAGALTPFIPTYAEHLTSLGYSPGGVGVHSRSIRHFGSWLSQSGIAVAEIDRDVVERFASHSCLCRGWRPIHLSTEYSNRVRCFVGFLARTGVIRQMPAAVADAIAPHIAEFQRWLKVHRATSDQTIAYYTRKLTTLLSVLGRDPAAYDVELVRRVIVDISRKYSRYHTRNMATTLRIYLRFLIARGECRPWLDHAVPSMANWRLAQLPRYLEPAKVERLIAACDPATPLGIRDRAIILLLARLGLRASDIVDMRLEDVEWEEGTLRVRGKGRLEIRLPLPQEVGDALLDYLNGVRVCVASNRIFLRSIPPFGPLVTSSAVSRVVERALKRSGITDAPSRGAHMLRHSAATNMLRGGATLDAIGTILRHRSTETTAHYAKVNIPMLRQITQPWPGGASC